MEVLDKIVKSLEVLREQCPLIHHITNQVTINDCANITLAIGASPVMTSDPREVVEMVAHAGALVLNIGTLHEQSVTAMLAAGKAAANLGIPIVLDPVGVGATKLRTQVAQELLQELPITIIRGNLGEIMCLTKQTTAMKGVDSQTTITITPELACHAAKSLGTVVAITGKIDAISDGEETILLGNGHEMLTKVTGTGCMTTSLIASFAAVTTPLLAAVSGITAMGLAGERAASDLPYDKGIGTFRVNLFDRIYLLTGETIRTAGRVLYHG